MGYNHYIEDLGKPFRWRGKDYRLRLVSFEHGEAQVWTDPENFDLRAELETRFRSTQGQGLTLCLGRNFIAFPEKETW